MVRYNATKPTEITLVHKHLCLITRSLAVSKRESIFILFRAILNGSFVVLGVILSGVSSFFQRDFIYPAEI